jgi:hypothetical protein
MYVKIKGRRGGKGSVKSRSIYKYIELVIILNLVNL